MATNEDPRHQMIQRGVMRRPEAIGDGSLVLWERLSVELTAIIGDSGFQTLYERSMHLARTRYPWLASDPDGGFASLRASLAQQEPAQAGAASIALLTIFSDTLMLLIGEPLTISILRSAWGQDTVDTAAKKAQQ